MTGERRLDALPRPGEGVESRFPGVDSLFALGISTLAPLDSVRSHVLRALGPVGARWYRSRSLRIATTGTLSAALALALVAYAPFALAILGPLLLGVPHVLADVRYLVVRPRLYASVPSFLTVVVGSLGAAYFGVRATCASIVVLALLHLARPRRALLPLALGVLASRACLAAPYEADQLFAHAHHVISLLIFVTFWRSAGSARWLVAGVAITAALAIASGALDSTLRASFSSTQLPVDAKRWVRSVALGTRGDLAFRVAAVFLFAQSFHYALWLRLVPDAERERRAPRGFRSSLRAARADLGGATLVVATCVVLGLLGWALSDALGARNNYLFFASFHGHLELLAALAWSLRSSPPGRSSSPGWHKGDRHFA